MLPEMGLAGVSAVFVQPIENWGGVIEKPLETITRKIIPIFMAGASIPYAISHIDFSNLVSLENGIALSSIALLGASNLLTARLKKNKEVLKFLQWSAIAGGLSLSAIALFSNPSVVQGLTGEKLLAYSSLPTSFIYLFSSIGDFIRKYSEKEQAEEAWGIANEIRYRQLCITK